jgi:hypothetical protein
VSLTGSSGRDGTTSTRTHRDADVVLLEGKSVVDSIARHRYDVASALQRNDDVLLLGRGDSPEDVVLLENHRQLVDVFWKLSGIERSARDLDPHVASHGRDGAWVVAGEYAQLHALLREVGQGMCCIGPGLLPKME